MKCKCTKKCSKSESSLPFSCKNTTTEGTHETGQCSAPRWTFSFISAIWWTLSWA